MSKPLQSVRTRTALGNGAHVIYAGDFNIYRSTEPMWDTLTGVGNGQAFDPVNQVGNWHDGAGFKGVHTQNPAGSGGVGGGMDDRFDWQMITGELQDNEGMSLLAGSYQGIRQQQYSFDQRSYQHGLRRHRPPC